MHEEDQPKDGVGGDEVKVAWATQMEGIGDGYGFTQGNRWGAECLRMAGVEIAADAAIAVHHCPPHAFRPIDGKVNVLWTAWEFPTLPDWELANLHKADVVCVTASFLIPVFERYTTVPVFYVPQGIDTNTFYPKHHTWARKCTTKKPFRVLWVGAANDRKGWQFVLSAWKAFVDRSNMQLYVKTTGIDLNLSQGNIIIDKSNVSKRELMKIYQSADCFAFPSMAEGFGFTLGEAMASGIPCVYTPHTAMKDMANDRVAIPLKAHMGGNFNLISPDRAQEVLVEAAEPDATDLALKILWVKEHPAQAQKIGRRAVTHIRRNFTWRQAGLKLRTILESLVRSIERAA